MSELSLDESDAQHDGIPTESDEEELETLIAPPAKGKGKGKKTKKCVRSLSISLLIWFSLNIPGSVAPKRTGPKFIADHFFSLNLLISFVLFQDVRVAKETHAEEGYADCGVALLNNPE